MAAVHMLKSLFRKKNQLVPAPSVPDDVRVYAIGDIHGRADLFDDMLQRIAADHAGRAPKRLVIVLLGDLVDRGPDSDRVVERALALEQAPGETHFLSGNHEELFLLALDGNRDATRTFTRVGGRETALSYGLPRDIYEHADLDELAGLMRERVPSEHIAFLERMVDLIEIGDYAFVHAGIRPGVPLAEQRGAHLRWIRTEFLEHDAPHPRFIIHGHTITDAVDVRSNRIGIDTGAYASGRLTAIGLDGTERWFIETA